MSNENSFLFFIPDISGFTHFVKETEIEHSTHIISELLEILIDSNELGLELSEIEGDALFFFKEGETPGSDEILNQCKNMFTRFHQHLKVYERDRICQCGACSTAHKLGLKFLIHEGKAIRREIRGKVQLMGLDVTLVHRLAKNSIPINEYILQSQSKSVHGEAWPDKFFGEEKKASKSSYEEIGELSYNYYDLKNLLSQVPDPPKRVSNIKKVSNPLINTIEIDCPIGHVHGNLIDLKKRDKWGARVGGDFNLPERLGTQHFCVVPQGNIKVNIVASEVKEGKIIYIEQFEKKGFTTPELFEIFTLESIGENKCKLVLESHPTSRSILKPIFRPLIKKFQGRSINKLKELCESELRD